VYEVKNPRKTKKTALLLCLLVMATLLLGAMDSDQLKTRLMELLNSSQISVEQIVEIYAVLAQDPPQDTPKQANIRSALEILSREEDDDAFLVFLNQRKGNCEMELSRSDTLPEEVEIFLDGKSLGFLGTGNMEVEGLFPGSYFIALDGNTVQRSETCITFEEDFAWWPISLAAQRAQRDLIVVSEPGFAKVWVDGEMQEGTTPLVVTLIVGQSYLVEVEKDGYKPLQLQVEIKEKGEPVEKLFALEKN